MPMPRRRHPVGDAMFANEHDAPASEYLQSLLSGKSPAPRSSARRAQALAL